jgi:ATP-dependent DNA helicase DinG
VADLDITSVFDQILAARGLTARPQQRRLIELIEPGQTRFAQAGTGTGKSYALLAAAVAAKRATGKPSVVVCPTNALVDQYVHKDGPAVASSTGATFTHIKGRSRYLCGSSRELSAMGDAGADLFDQMTREHGTADLDRIGLDSAQWGCPGSKRCAGDACGAMLARKAAAAFDVVITNAHVLVWDRRVRDWTGGMVRLLPEYGALFVDECHELDATGRSCLSDQITPRSRVFGLMPGIKDWVAARVACLVRDGRTEMLFEPDLHMDEWRDRIETLAHGLRLEIERQRTDDFPDFDHIRHLSDELDVHERFLDLFKSADDDGARFITTIDDTGNLNRICIDAAPLVGRILRAQTAALVSGTVPLSLPARLGAGDATVNDVGHPFDYSRSQLVVSRHDARSTSAMVRSARVASLVRAIRQTGGGTLVLFTSWADLDSVMPQVARQLGPRIPVYVQSKDDPASLAQDVQEFRQHGNAVLAGVRSLFTGIDIPGEALRQVVLWKLPYPVPTLERQAIERIHGKQVYYDEMLTSLAQGVGRLVRTVADSGRVLILDSRARTQRWSASPLTAHLAEFAHGGQPQLASRG